jgi:TonB family protein
MGKVFALTDEDLLKSAPPWWQDYLATELGLAPKEKEKPDATALSRSVKPDENEPAKISSTGERIYPIAGLTAPKATFQPEPEFNDEARKAHYQGVVLMNIVIGSDGAVHDVVLVRPLGMGLDEMAVKGVKTWRFKPAAKNGEPVAVQVLVEMNFHFYR